MKFLSGVRISLLAVLLLVWSNDGLALGLGEVRVDSFLNQPLEARVRLLDASEEELDSLTASIAGSDDFERLGLMSSVLALNLQVDLDRSVSPPVLEIRSASAVTDPVLQLLVDVRWSAGRLLREYTLFLDPATVEIEPPPPAPETAPEPAPTTRTEPRSEPGSATPPRVRARDGGGRYGPVASGETLWTIASANRPTDDVTMDQIMLAIVDLNPRAFRDGNVNRLLRGAELQLPSAEQVRIRDAATAAAEVAAQNRAFRAGRTSPPRVSDAGRIDVDPAPAPEDPNDSETGDRTAPMREPRLSLIPPQDGDPTASGTNADEAEVLSAMQQRLARAEEELYAARQETAEFRDRVAQLERLVQAQAQGVAIEESELAALEDSLRDAREREAADPGATSLDDGLTEASQAEVASADAVAPSSAAGEGDADSATDRSSTTQETTEMASTPVANASTPPMIERLLAIGPLWMAGIGVALLVLIVLLVLWLRSRRSPDEDLGHPLRRARDLPVGDAPATRDPVARARDQVARDPASLSAHLGLLRALAGVQAADAFGRALEDMYARVEDDDHPLWKEALKVASPVVPDHALVKGSSDWIATRDAGPGEDPRESLEEDTRVDDLMARLDADLDEDEADDSDWLTDAATDESGWEPDEGPRLREPDVPSERARGNLSAAPPIDADTEVLPGIEMDHPNEARTGEDEEDADDLVLDWPDVDDTEIARPATTGAAEDEEDEVLDFGPSGKSAASSSRKNDGGSASDIFAPTEDDIEVKLDLARAYMSWNTPESARTLLEEILREGTEVQQQEARRLLDDIGSAPDDESGR